MGLKSGIGDWGLGMRVLDWDYELGLGFKISIRAVDLGLGIRDWD